MSEPLLLADSIGKSFRGRKVLRSASLWAHAGRVTALVGGNGAGKSTLLRIVAGLTAPEHGIIRFSGETWERTRLHQLAMRGMLLFSPDLPFFSTAFSIRQHLEAVRGRFGLGGYDGVVEELGIGHVLDQRARTLSGGERRRAEVAVALYRAPLCLLADEPFRGIDPRDRETVSAVLRRAAAAGAAVVVTGHEIDVVLDVANEVIWCESGTTTSLGRREDAEANWRFRREYLGRR